MALGARAVEKHFTDDNDRVGPDHKFALNPVDWAAMVDNTRRLERALGSGDKFIAANEAETVILQRRCLRAACDLSAGTVLARDMIDVLRPAPADAIKPYEIKNVLGRRLLVELKSGQELKWEHIGSLTG